ncbi:cytosine deaminase domain protein [Burkholderia mallei]|nr:cytosine deaminase domain protein [Burkholderia mallei]KOS79521.1 cytosine deaminase domain protein [Burkholderia mallei]KOT01387.1 cytosine deaminase domain protein [Burkholderia mallei]KOT16061.1 cytosine deaminase domain protein [Burkholderia mallei]KOT21822.1 cytosine deaminase domain protein [Burkholderia mallei]
MHLGERYGIEPGRPANLVVLDASDDYEALRRQAKALLSIRGGEVIMRRVPERIAYPAAR